jgi:MFS family permease
MVWRVLTGIGASGVIPLTFALIGDLFPFNQRGAKLGLVFAAMEGDGCWVSRGALLEPFVGWQTLFIGTSVITAIVLWLLRPYRSLFDSPKVKKLPSVQQVFAGYRTVLSKVRGARPMPMSCGTVSITLGFILGWDFTFPNLMRWGKWVLG